ncbi:MAG: CRISPR-associated protein Cas4 [Clostridiales bacterium]|jgi:CRISPR-associated exonuclease Cas4|nr:CRISPR-associated protein Cas4 [Clostridiales bacterium]
MTGADLGANINTNEDNFLPISAIQHFVFCKRQWGLIHIENQWADNLRTIEGEILHAKAHDPFLRETRGDKFISRGMPVKCAQLGIFGVCDIVEFVKDSHGVEVFGRDGTYNVFPIEYKRGAPKENPADRLQLAAQALCLEEMLCCKIPLAYLYYGEIKHRVAVEIDADLRLQLTNVLSEMRGYYDRKHVPKVKRSKSCNACSLNEICLPVLMKNTNIRQYINSHINEAE